MILLHVVADWYQKIVFTVGSFITKMGAEAPAKKAIYNSFSRGFYLINKGKGGKT